MSKENQTPATNESDGYLAGKLLIAMPSLGDARFARAVIFICQHDDGGAMGLVINHGVPGMTFRDLISQLEFPSDLMLDTEALKTPLMHGGPVDGGRGFIIHDASYAMQDTVRVNNDFSVTATLPILQEIATGKGPERLLFVLGYAGWTAGQLEGELKQNAWLVAEANAPLFFETPSDDQWDRALNSIGIDPAMLSGAAGQA